MSDIGILVTSSRDWLDAPFVWNALSVIRVAHPDSSIDLYHGACPSGGDFVADSWATQPGLRRVVVLRYPADWNQYGRGAGPIRNQNMVRDFHWTAYTVRYALAFRKGGESSRGTTGCIKLLRAAGTEPTIYEFEDIYS